MLRVAKKFKNENVTSAFGFRYVAKLYSSKTVMKMFFFSAVAQSKVAHHILELLKIPMWSCRLNKTHSNTRFSVQLATWKAQLNVRFVVPYREHRNISGNSELAIIFIFYTT